MSVMFQGGPLDGQTGGPPPEQPSEQPSASLSGKPTGGPEDEIRTAVDALGRYIQAESEDADIAKAMKHLTGLQDLLAKLQAEKDGLMQGKASPAAFRRANGAQA